METVNYIVPIGKVDALPCQGKDYKDRLQTLQFVIDEMLPNQKGVRINLIIVEQSIDGYSHFVDKLKLPPRTHINYELIQVRWPIFNKPWLCNLGMIKAVGPHCIIADSDMFAPQDFFKNLIEWVQAKRHKWCFAWTHLYYMDYSEKNKLINGERQFSFVPDRIISPQPRKAEGGMVYFDSTFYKTMGKANEWIEELGGPDNDLVWRAKHLTKSYPKFNNLVYHLWHPRKPIRTRDTRIRNIGILRYMYGHTTHIIKMLKERELGHPSGPITRLESFFQARTS